MIFGRQVLIERVRQALDGGLLRLARKKSLKRDTRRLEIVECLEELKLYHHFEFDRGIQIDHLEDICPCVLGSKRSFGHQKHVL